MGRKKKRSLIPITVDEKKKYELFLYYIDYLRLNKPEVLVFFDKLKSDWLGDKFKYVTTIYDCKLKKKVPKTKYFSKWVNEPSLKLKLYSGNVFEYAMELTEDRENAIELLQLLEELKKMM